MRFMSVMRDERGFVHKRLLGIGKALIGKVAPEILPFIPGVGSIIPTLSRFIPGLGGPIRTRGGQTFQPPRREQVFTPVPTRQRAAVPLPSIPEIIDVITDIIPGGGGSPIPGGGLGINGNGLVCRPPLVPNDRGTFCEFPGSPAGGVGEALMGQFGAALEPSFFTINQRRCLPGMILGKDKLCYNVGAISNKERLWPKGAAPLLTGGEMSAIRKASTAAGKFNRAGKRLAAVGKAFSGPARRPSTSRRLRSGGTVKVLESGPGSVQL